MLVFWGVFRRFFWGVKTTTGNPGMFYVNAEDGLSTWDNPLSECLRQVISCGRGYLQATLAHMVHGCG